MQLTGLGHGHDISKRFMGLYCQTDQIIWALDVTIPLLAT